MRWGLGPVFLYECLTNSRRWQTYALRAVGVAALLIAMGTIAFSRDEITTGSSYRNYANLGRSYFFALIGVELALVMLAAPAATAGSICVDRARGTLAHMLMTDLSDPEIVLGKLAARLLPVFGLVACTWPVMAISSLLGGIDPIALTLAVAIILAVAVLGCTMALALSVWARKTHEVILTTYTVFILVMLIWPIWYLLSVGGLVVPPPSWTPLANPFYVAFAPYIFPGKLEFWDYLVFFGVVLGASAGFTGLAVWRTRPVACRGSVQDKRGRVGLVGRIIRSLPGPSLDRNPVLWREWHRSRPSRWMTALLALLMGTTGALCIVGAVAMWRNGFYDHPGAYWETAGICAYLLHVIFGLLMLSAIAPTSMAEERQRGSLDVLATTTLSTRAIVVGKWLGTFRLAVPMSAAPALLVLAMATARSDETSTHLPGTMPNPDLEITLGVRLCGVLCLIATILAHSALITSIGLALAVWIKRQSRAIAFSVALFVLVIAAWPIFVAIAIDNRANLGRDLASLSPYVACMEFLILFANRMSEWGHEILWCDTFWAVEVSTLAMGLLWLTVRTFDRSFGRIPDRPSRISVQAMVVMILAAMIGAASLVLAIGVWIEGGRVVSPVTTGILPYCLFLAVGLVLIVVVSERSISTGRARRALERVRPSRGVGETHREEAPAVGGFRPPCILDEALTVPGWRFLVGRWWESFRLVLLLASGPAVLGMALATAPERSRLIEKTTTNASGISVVTYVRSEQLIEHASTVHLGHRLIGAVLWIVTILVHGAGAVGIGLAFAIAKGWSRRVLGVGLGFILLLAFVLPFALMNVNRGHFLESAAWSFVIAAQWLLDPLASRSSFIIRDILWSVFFWDVVLALGAFGLVWWTGRAWRRQSREISRAKSRIAADAEDNQPAAEAVLIGD
jgi:ABC-type Na+ efflux pump permease subunit